MKIQIPEDKARRIADRNHNRFVAEGIDAHRVTQLAPPSLLYPLSEELVHTVEEQHESIESRLRKILGKPTYSRPGFIVYCADCTDVLPRLERADLSVDLTVTSPPYNIGKEYEQLLGVEEYVEWCSQWMTDIYQITKSSGAFWLNVGYFEVKGHGLCVPIPYLIWNRSPFYLLQEVVWKYGAGVTAKRRLSPRNEKWLFYVKDPERYTFNLDEIRDPNVKYPNQKKNGKYRCNPLGKNPSDVWEFPKVTTGEKRSSQERTGHPAQFPLPIVERIVLASSDTGGLVIDPFAGSFSAGIAAAGLGRIFIGIEIREDYCNLAAERYERFQRERIEAHRQGKLF